MGAGGGDPWSDPAPLITTYWHGTAVLMGWAILALAAGLTVLKRRDV
ncbi:MAG: hypothetical protein LBD90_02295 [Bifidobacteriaceae bacterium]|nr:hypothetical protein [Bifidobacteriaceae bacterium]